MKKILLLGGSAQQIIAIQTAKRLGLYTVLCDYLPDNPGQYYADAFYLKSTTDKEAVLKVAEAENVDGVLAYASDPAAPTAAFVAEKLGLKTSPFKSVEILCNKDKFRSFLRENGFNTPRACGYSEIQEALADIGRFSLPVIIKPVDSSGSKGATVLHHLDKLNDAIEFAFFYSKSHRIIVEEFIEKKHPYLIGGDVFVDRGKIVLWGLMNCHRDNNVNPLVPVGKSYPLELENTDVESVKATLQCLVDRLHITSCAMNVELVVDRDGKVWPIDVGPRNGGNMIPDLLSLIFNIDVVEMSIKAAIGEKLNIPVGEGNPYYATHNLHTDKNGVFKSVVFSDKLKPYIIRTCIYKKPGDVVEYFDNAAKALGIVFLKFNNKDEMEKVLSNINSYIFIDINLEGDFRKDHD